ncbi:MAG TPA: STAS domain-containing protein [Candidatus Cloacimonadota bacterium]|nr:STAS domain-containing protein [Candidatus Cloacimonadota bacterium]
MFSHNVVKKSNYVSVALQGRIDGMTSPELECILTDLVTEGWRQLCINLAEIHYISSMGLRVFLKLQKQLSRADGKIVIQCPSEEVKEVFSLGGFDSLFDFIDADETNYFVPQKTANQEHNITWNKLHITEKISEGKAGNLRILGSPSKQNTASYTNDDVEEIYPANVLYGCGLAALGKGFENYADFFGESLIIDHNCLVYPAVPHPAVDMMLGGDQPYHFLNGFGFDGIPGRIVLLEHESGFVTLEDVVKYIQESSDNDLNGIIFLGECKGLWGMNLRKVPLKKNNPLGENIMEAKAFTSWMNFPIEPSDFNKLLIGCGIIRKHQQGLLEDIFPPESDFHLHGGVFEEGIIKKSLTNFLPEIEAILAEAECTKVQHLLGKTCFSSLIVGIVPLQVQGA